MAAVAFDSLEYAHRLEAAGMPREQAEVVAKGLTTMFIHNFDALVTKDYLDTRFDAFDARVENRLVVLEGNMKAGFAQQDARMDGLESRLAVRFESIDGKISRIYLMFGLTMVTATIPILQNFLGQ